MRLFSVNSPLALAIRPLADVKIIAQLGSEECCAPRRSGWLCLRHRATLGPIPNAQLSVDMRKWGSPGSKNCTCSPAEQHAWFLKA